MPRRLKRSASGDTARTLDAVNLRRTPGTLNKPAGDVLAQLDQGAEATIADAAYRIDQLAKQDLAERLPDPRDRRGYLVRLTPRGKKIVDTVMARMQAEFNERLAPFAQVAGGHDVLEAALRLFEACIEPRGG